MEIEEKQDRSTWIRVIGILLQIGSVIAVFALSVYCLKTGDKDYLYYDRESGVLLPPESYKTACIWLFWTGFAGGMLVFAYEILRTAGPVTKAVRSILAVLLFVVTIFLNALGAASMYVDEGLGFQADYEVVGEEDEFFVIAYWKVWDCVQVYYVAEQEGTCYAFWVDGHDKEEKRTYAVTDNPDGFFNTERMIYVYEEGDDNPWINFINIMFFPGQE